mmetsp:Transcript_2318/g.5880  ORF Transcript_2318/g.5880 Transcript_2318/m.5880 type:complete len:123 (+) Transcript_2318:1015-1383(+)
MVEPKQAQVLRHSLGKESPAHAGSGQHKIQGGGYSMAQLPFAVEAHRAGHVDGFLSVTDEQAIATTRALAKEEGIFGGFSAGANIAAALQLIDRGEATTVVAIVCDSGVKYLSTDLFEPLAQ